jgi:hypothetical protein
MKKTKLLITLFVACYSFSSAQRASVKGVIFDTINKLNVANASVSLLQQKDSTLYKFIHSDATGNFKLKNLLPGNYLLLVTHPGYENFNAHLKLNDTSHVDMTTVMMTLRANILKAVFVHEQVSIIKIKGDTTEFAVDSFGVRIGASVEEMLKKLPGIQVDKDGTITAMGEKVNKVLVDGEEFFGANPTIATKNLQANAIDKVQVFDKKSDQATFTGIDDGEGSKTINLKLKEDRKKGYFGKLDLAAGLNDKWNNSAMINRFRDKKKLSVYGAMRSTDVSGLDWQHDNQFVAGNGLESNDNIAMIAMSQNNNDELNSLFNSDGLPKSWAAGLNYSNKFNGDRQSINGSYNYNKVNNEGYINTLSQSILPDTTFFNNELSKTFSSGDKHSINGTYEWQINNSTSIKINAFIDKGNSDGASSFNSESRNENGNTVNNSIRNMNAIGNDQHLQSFLLLRKKFKKTGRTISLGLEQQYGEYKMDGYLYALNSFFDKNGTISLRDTTDQKKINESVATAINAKLVYTEPLSKNLFVELNYALHNNKSDAKRLSFDKNLNGKYDYLNDTFSNHYNFNVLTNEAGFAFKYSGTRVTFSFGSNIAKQNFAQKDIYEDSSFKEDFTNFFPKANLTYKFNENNHLSIIYNGKTKQPSIRQVQPIPSNLNPLNIIVGNPFLKPEFDHMVNVNFNSFSISNQRGIFLYGSFSLQSNAIVTNSFTDTLGRSVYQYVNTNGNYNYASGFNYFINLERIDLNINTGLDFNKSRYTNVVNYEKNITNNITVGLHMGINKDDENKYSLYYNGDIDYNISTPSIRKDLQTKYWTQDHSVGLTLTLPWRFELNNEVQGSFQQKTELFNDNNNVVLWNAYFGKKILRNDKGIIKIVAHDILNQNIGYSRYVNSNVIEETNYQSVARYFLLSFIWNFSKESAASSSLN